MWSVLVLIIIGAGAAPTFGDSVVAWGHDDLGYGLISGALEGDDFVAVTAGAYTAHALRSDGRIAAWGHDDWGLVADTPTDAGYVAVAASYFTAYALRSDGTIAVWGSHSFGLEDAPDDDGYVAVRSEPIADTHAQGPVRPTSRNVESWSGSRQSDIRLARRRRCAEPGLGIEARGRY